MKTVIFAHCYVSHGLTLTLYRSACRKSVRKSCMDARVMDATGNSLLDKDADFT